MQSLGTLAGGTYSYAFAINDSGQVAGYSGSSQGERAFIYTNGTMQSLGTLAGGTYSSAWAINDSGQVAGYSGSSQGNRGFIYTNGTMQSLGTLAGGTYSVARAINDSGQVVGQSGSSVGNRAFLYNNGTMLDLFSLAANGSAWSDTTAWDINAAGQIVGYGTIGGVQHAFLLTPDSVAAVPLPAAFPLLLGGLGVFGTVARRRGTPRALVPAA